MIKTAVILRADSNIGTGHLMRVNHLFEHVLSRYELHLISDSIDQDSLKPLLKGYNSVTFCHLEEIVKRIDCLKPDLVFIDDYSKDYEFEKSIASKYKIAVIDDLDRTHICDVLFDGNPLKPKDSYQGKIPKNCRLCMGDNYCLVQQEFFDLKDHEIAIKPRVLVNFGGSDPASATLKTMQAVKDASLDKKYAFTVITGISNPLHDEILKICRDLVDINIMRHTDNVAKVLSFIDVAIGACGGMFKERIAARIPTVNVEIADNQAGSAQTVEKYKLGNSLKVYELADPKKLDEKLSDLLKNRQFYIENCRRFIKPHGIDNYVRALDQLFSLQEI
ncbi:MAG: UDP-2,4-diacetamido-2,4,6-trideoxy-beta-L-altropyranose hydrolase [Succinivibrio sp.]